MEAGGPHSSPGLCDTGNVCPQGMRPGQGAEEVQVRGVEEAHGAISAATEDVVLAHRDAVGHGGLQAEGLKSAWPPTQTLLSSHLPRGDTSQGRGRGESSPAALAQAPQLLSRDAPPSSSWRQRAHSHVHMGDGSPGAF